MPYNHGVRVVEQPTATTAPVNGTAGLQVVFGTAPVNLAEDPTAATNTPVIAYTFEEAVKKLGYSDDWESYTLCQAMYASFKLFAVAPVIFVNVLDPATHKIDVTTAAEVTVTALQANLGVKGVLKSTVVVKAAADGDALVADTDYVLTFDDTGDLVITLLATGSAAASTKLYVTYTKLNPTAVTAANVVGATSGATETGLEVLRQVYPKFGLVPGIITAPGWSQNPDVGIALAAKCEEINGYFACEAFVDIDSSATGCTVYTGVKTAKESAGITSPHVMALWPCLKSGSYIFDASAVFGALTQYTDALNDDVPSLIGNKALPITAACLKTGAEVLFDQVQANAVNAAGVTTALNVGGWKSWGNNSAAYPTTTDPKDRWFNCRRFFSWWGNNFQLTYASKVDDPANFRLVESIVDGENIRGNAYVASGKCAAVRCEFNETENQLADIMNGKLTFHLYLAPWTPAEDIVATLEFDPDGLVAALNGGAA